MYAHELFEQNKPRVVVTYPGRFQPWHSGHSGVFSQLQKKFGSENVYIATSNDQSSAKSPFNFSDKYQLMTAAGVPADKIIQTNAMYALPEGIDPTNTIFVTAVGAPDADRLNPDSVLKRDKKDKEGNVIKPAGSPGYYKKWNPSQDPLTADQHGYVIIIPEIKKSVTINGQTYDVSHGTETRNLWNTIRDDDKARSEFLSQMYGRPSQELANIFDKIPQTASEDVVADNGDSTSPIHGGQIYETEGNLEEKINLKTTTRGFHQEKDMGWYKLIALGDFVSRMANDPPTLRIVAQLKADPATGRDGAEIGELDLKVAQGEYLQNNTGAEALVAGGVYVDDEYQRKGVGSAMYQFAKELGNDVIASISQSDDAKAMWSSMNKKGVAEDLNEACWKGYHKEGMKTMFGKRYPNCVKNKNESLETYIRKGECPGCGGSMVAEGQLNEKQDACYHKVKSRYKVWPSAYASGALVQCRKKGAANWGNKSESITQEEYDQLDENLKKWFSDKWVRFGPDGKIRGNCARGDSSEGKPKCLPQSKAHSLGKKGRASAAAKKRREDPNPERKGPAINVATKTKSNEDASGVIATKKQARDPRYSMSLTKDVRPGQIEKNLRAFKLAEQQQNSNTDMFELFAKFLPLAMRDLGLTVLPKIVPELRIESNDGQATFGRFVNDEMAIHLALANRHPVDILRTLAHELVHFKQLTLGKIKDTSGITGSPEENQANTIAGIIMRHFNKQYPDAVNMQPIDLDESLVTVNYGIGKNPGKLIKVGPGGRVPHAKLHVNVDKKTAKKLGIPHLNENGDDEAGEIKKQKNLIPFPKGTVKVDVSDVYDWYKLGMEISDLDDADPADFGKGPPQTVMAFGDEEQEHKYLPQLQRLGLKTHDIDENFADGRNPGDKGSLKAKVKGKVTMAKAKAILSNSKSTARAKQLAHWFINMNKGRAK